MSADLIVTTFGVLIFSLAMFVVQSVPRWIWPILAIAFITSDQASKLHLRPAADRKEACEWRCQKEYPSTGRFFLTQPVCIDRCCRS